MITDVEKWHYLTLKILSKLLHGNTSKHNDGKNYLYSFGTESKLKTHENV